MKWKRKTTEFLPEKTFLVIKDEDISVKRLTRRNKSKSAADTGTWPPKVKKLSAVNPPERPKTANLAQPSILDPNLVNKLDMSLLSKELLCDSMTRIQLGVLEVSSSDRRRRSVQSDNYSVISSLVDGSKVASRTRQKRRSLDHSEHLASKESQLEPVMLKKNSSPSPPTSVTDRAGKRRSTEARKLDDNNNKNTNKLAVSSLSTVRTVKSSKSTIPVEIEVFTNPTAKLAPEPCTTCGRPDQPERFHSHPKGVLPSKVYKDTGNSSKPKEDRKTIQKPVALNFRSEKTKNKIREEKIEMENLELAKDSTSEFGATNLSIHEPKSMQKWERENNSPSQKRTHPQRPIVFVSDERWNSGAWEQSQTQLVPCSSCGRTFLPERLSVHQKSCKASAKSNERSGSLSGPSMVFCQVCGRSFGKSSIKIHERECLKRWQAENDTLPPSQRKNEPTKRDKPASSSHNLSSVTSPNTEGFNKRLKTCYICGRDFGSASIDIHIPQCLKKSKLSGQKRSDPTQKVIESPTSGNVEIDWAATTEARWQSHLGQLVPCKHCKRTFNPDRVEIHERNCKGKT